MKRLTLVILTAVFLLFLSGCAETYTITFDSAGGDIDEVIEVSEGETTTLPTPVKEGYTFMGWVTGDGPNDVQFSNILPVEQNITLYARWQPNEYTITFNTLGGNQVESMKILEGESPNLPTPMKEGYIFEGWYKDLELNDKFDSESIVSKNLTLNAKWEPKVFTITFMDSNDEIIEVYQVEYGDPIRTPNQSVDTAYGYEFAGWISGSIKIEEIENVTSNKTFSPQFSRKKIYIEDTYLQYG
jgi:uncharacterized repeat protein (TIGR02543 family)